MKTIIKKYGKIGLSVLFGIGVFLFWFLCYPHALNYQEQYQLFLWTSDYFMERCSVPGGFSEWLGEFVVQFYYVKWIGALLLALLFIALQRAVWKAMDKKHYLLSFIPSVLLFWLLGDPSVLLGYVWALLLAIAAYVVNPLKADVVVVPLLYWLAGPLAWVYVLLRLFGNGWKWTWQLPFYLLALQLFTYHYLLVQWPREMVLLPMQYYRIPLDLSPLMWIIPVVVIAVVLLSRLKLAVWMIPVEGAIVIVLCWLGISKGYDKEMYELICQDDLIRHEHWDDVIKRAQVYQVRTPFWSQSVNLSLAMKRQLAERQFEFYQSGQDALFMQMIRDMTSDLPTAEAFWRLGMVNSAYRYMFDVQQSILNARMSGRCMKRMTECCMVNKMYSVAEKNITLLKKSLFYRSWAEAAEKVVMEETKGVKEAEESQEVAKIKQEVARVRKLRFKEDFLFSYPEIDKILGRLFVNNPENKMALDYFMGQLLLKGDVQNIMQYMGWVQQYGGYRYMPVGYQDAVRCIQQHGDVPDSPYGRYIRQMVAKGGQP